MNDRSTLLVWWWISTAALLVVVLVLWQLVRGGASRLETSAYLGSGVIALRLKQWSALNPS